jgi:hypothetical protein
LMSNNLCPCLSRHPLMVEYRIATCLPKGGYYEITTFE